MALDDLLSTMERRPAATPDTPCNPVKVSVKPAPILACTLDTADTPLNDDAGNDSIPLSDQTAEARRQRVLGMLAERPDVKYAVLTDTKADPEAVLLALAIRGTATCELHIPRSKYDGILLLDLIERHGGTVH